MMTVMAGLVPAIHVLICLSKEDVDARHKAGHDAEHYSAAVAKNRFAAAFWFS